MKLTNLIDKLKERKNSLEADLTILPQQRDSGYPSELDKLLAAREKSGYIKELTRIIEALEIAKAMGAEE